MNRQPVAISGISGRFPHCESFDQLVQSLFDKVDLVTEPPERFGPNAYRLFPEIPRRSGKVLDWHKFDADFFAFNTRLADRIDPQSRKLIEVTYEAILDAGLTLNDLRENRTGIFGGFSHNEIDRSLTADELISSTNQDAQQTFELFHRQMGCHWLAYLFDIKGPLYDYESACSSALTGFVDAYHQLASGQLDIALICTANLNLSPHLQLQYVRLNMISADGACRFLDANGSGYVKSEAAICIIMQRANLPVLKRVRAMVRGAEYNTDGHKKEGITYPSSAAQAKLIKRCLKRSNVDPHQVTYVEAHGTGTKAGDYEEMKAIDSVYNSTTACFHSKCGGRTKVLQVGSIKTNCGHAEASSGLLSIAKVLSIFQTNQIPPSIHFEKPNMSIDSLVAGRIQPVQQTMPFESQFIAISSFGFGGSNVHLILEDPKRNSFLIDKFGSSANNTNDHLKKSPSDWQHFKLALVSARNPQSVEELIEQIASKLKAKQLNDLELMHLNRFAISAMKDGFDCGGYLLYDQITDSHDFHVGLQTETANSFFKLRSCQSAHDSSIKSIESTKLNRRPIVFLVPGLGCQWNGMGASLASISLFADRMAFYCSLIQPAIRFDLLDCLLGKPTSNGFDLHTSIYCLLGLAVFQMSLIDFISELGVQPDVFVGHSYGELICAWIDRLIDARQVLYSTLVLCELAQPELTLRSDAAKLDYKLTKGSMAVLSCGAEQANRLLKQHQIDRVQVACDNSFDCVTISGECEQVQLLLNRIQSDKCCKVTGKLINCCNMAFHSELVNEYFVVLTKQLEQVMGDFCYRSASWISTSIDLQNNEENQHCLLDRHVRNKSSKSIGDYFAKCILSPVNFRQACSKLKDDFSNCAYKPIVIEIAPKKYVSTLAKSEVNFDLLPTLMAPRSQSTNAYEDYFGSNHLQMMKMIGQLHEYGVPVNMDFFFEKPSMPLINSPLSLASMVRWNHEQNRLVRSYPDYFNPCPGNKSFVLQDFVDLQLFERTNFALSITDVLQLILISIKSTMQSESFKGIELFSFNWHTNKKVTRTSLFDFNWLPSNETDSTLNSFEVCCDKRQLAFGQVRLLNVINFKIKNNWNKKSDFQINDCFHKELIQQNYDQNQLEVFHLVSKSSTCLFGKANCTPFTWKQQLEGTVQLSLNQTHLNWNSIECVHIVHLAVDLTDATESENEVYYDFCSNQAFSESIELNQISFLFDSSRSNDIQSQTVAEKQVQRAIYFAKHHQAKLAFCQSLLFLTENLLFAVASLATLCKSVSNLKIILISTKPIDLVLKEKIKQYLIENQRTSVNWIESANEAIAQVEPASIDMVICDHNQLNLVDFSLNCVAEHGQWIYLTGHASAINYKFQLGHLLRNITCIGIDRNQIDLEVGQCKQELEEAHDLLKVYQSTIPELLS